MIRASTLCPSLLLIAACGSGAPEPTTRAVEPAALPELRAPLPEPRAWFDSHRGEARFNRDPVADVTGVCPRRPCGAAIDPRRPSPGSDPGRDHPVE